MISIGVYTLPSLFCISPFLGGMEVEVRLRKQDDLGSRQENRQKDG